MICDSDNNSIQQGHPFEASLKSAEKMSNYVKSTAEVKGGTWGRGLQPPFKQSLKEVLVPLFDNALIV